MLIVLLDTLDAPLMPALRATRAHVSTFATDEAWPLGHIDKSARALGPWMANFAAHHSECDWLQVADLLVARAAVDAQPGAASEVLELGAAVQGLR